ncbi:10 TM acyl transferase domain found in Cas1p-domain-containing protein [Yarrowia lipolytica]|nr:10 TM acyl transferase domain found in Cas1p-domain-containing protein [Yarrowia lipolytica]RDW51794.1 10 TM acyl transferase domain found in Cas1p-domain-containing protein [Yarrowia lipolytica]
MMNNILGWFALFAFCGTVIRLLAPGDGYHCESTLESSGMWLQPAVGRYQPPRNWQPKQCMLRTFDRASTAQCLTNETSLFIGDSHAREMFWAVVKDLDPNYDTTNVEKHSNIEVAIDGVSLKFFWDPYFNNDGMFEMSKIANDQEQKERIKMVHISTGMWYIHNKEDKDAGFKEWKQALRRLNEIVAAQDDAGRRALEFITVSPMLLPDYVTLTELKDEAHLKGLDAQYLSRMNTYLDHNFNKNPYRKTRISVPFSFVDMRNKGGRAAFKRDGIHLNTDVYKTMSDILRNVRCNQELLDHKYDITNGPVYPFSDTCCIHYKQPRTMGQVLLLGVICAILPIIYLGQRYTRSDYYPRFVRYVSWPVPSIQDETLLTACVVIAASLAYSFFCDRTQFFGKSSKQFEASEFWVLILLFLVATGYSFEPQNDNSFLNRHQTEEWKGWMQIIILIYHITGASKILPIYKFVRVLVAAYLFMTGFGHATFFIKRGDFSLKRATSVLFRMNFLSILLTYVMDTDYLFYYFAPLVSFWFCVVWITFRVLPSWNSIDTSVGPVLAKISASAVILNILVRFQLPFQIVFAVLKYLFNIQWNLREWRFRLILDIYIVYIGMFAAVATLRYKQGNFPLKNLVTNRLVLGVVALITFIVYIAVAASFGIKQNYNQAHPYISWMPIVAFVILRNITVRFRSHYSTWMSFIGTCSLETFTLQFHFFLAADTKGRLYILNTPTSSGVLGMLQKYLNFGLVTVIFIIVSHAVAEQSNALTKLFVGNQDQQLPEHVTAQSQPQGEQIDMGDSEPPVSTRRPPGRVVAFLKTHTLQVKIVVAFAFMWVFNMLP